jgi:hypothetical protein
MLNEASINFFMFVGGAAFSFAGLSGAYEILRTVSPRPQEIRYFKSILLISLVVVLGALTPLALAESPRYLVLSSYTLFACGSIVLAIVLYEVRSKRVRVQHPKTFLVMSVVSAACLIGVVINGQFVDSVIWYKLSLLWMAFVLGYRFYLFVRHVVQLPQTQPVTP